MTLPVVARIEDEIRIRLKDSIIDRSAEIGQVEIVRPGRFVGNSASIVVQKASDRQSPTSDLPGNPPAVAYEALFNVHCLIESAETEAEFSSQCERAYSEIVTAITTPSVSPVTWFRFGGLAIRSWFGDKRDLPTDTGKKGGITVPLYVLYRVAENDPTQVR